MKNETTNESFKQLEENIIEFYLLLDKRIKTRNINLNKNSLKRTAEIQTEKENLQSSNKLSHIFHNLTELIDIYTDLKAEIQINNYFEEKKRFEKVSPNALEAQQESYESLIRKLEADLRNHMKTEFEMKLHIESLESRFEYLNQFRKENKILNEKLKKLEDSKKENEIIILKAENKNLKDIIAQKEIELDKIVQEYSAQIKELNKKIINQEESSKLLNSKMLIESDHEKSTYRSTYSLHQRSHSYLTNNINSNSNNKETTYSPNLLSNNKTQYTSHNSGNDGNTYRILTASNSNFNVNQINILKNIEFKNAEKLRAKFTGIPSRGSSIFDENKQTKILNFNNEMNSNLENRSSNKNNNNNNANTHRVVNKNISRKLISREKNNNANYLNETYVTRNDNLQKSSIVNSSNSNSNIYHSLKKPKTIGKIAKGILNSQNQKL